jgi:D-alanyl-D-alanine carboxypeptidase/D-alanyl-D-alanine-endopeptidase (penicillin-binding protein 4)
MKRLLLATVLIAAPAAAQDSLRRDVDAALATAPAGTRFGLLVVDEGGREVIAIDADKRFIPASNTKMFTTATAYATLGDLTRPDAAAGTRVRLEQGDVVLEGRGDAHMSGAADCTVDCLATLADAVAAKTTRVHDVVGDDSWFPDERWSPGMSWNNIPTRSGTGISALTLDDDEIALKVTPGALGRPPLVAMPGYYTLENRAVTVAGGKTDIGFDRAPKSPIQKFLKRSSILRFAW